jgi:DNA/RNA-binding domain of Phe-tRNA-synthetase-like protein
MEFRISEEILRKFPEVSIGCVFASNLSNAQGVNNELFAEIKAETVRLTTEFSLDTISQAPFVARWREIYRSFGAKPSDYRSSIENLIRMALKGRELTHINTLVDVYNLISLKYRLPVGGEDVDRMTGALQLVVATGQEPPVQLLGDQEAESPFPGEVLYRDDAGVICRCWNWREGQRTMLTEDTKNAILVIEANCAEEYELLDAALNELQKRVAELTGATCQKAILSGTNSSVTY